MVTADIDQETGNGVIIMKPNNSASWEFNLLFLASQVLIAAVLAALFVVQGLWLILPFSGLELLALFSGLYLCVRKNFSTEVLTFSEHLLRVERGRKTIEHSWEYQRPWTKILVRAAAFRGHPKKILIRCYGKELEIGAFLNKRDKEILIAQLKHIIYG